MVHDRHLLRRREDPEFDLPGGFFVRFNEIGCCSGSLRRIDISAGMGN
jgi:hypothetical protein